MITLTEITKRIRRRVNKLIQKINQKIDLKIIEAELKVKKEKKVRVLKTQMKSKRLLRLQNPNNIDTYHF